MLEILVDLQRINLFTGSKMTLRKRGRPKGTIGGKRFTEPWNPQKWKPLYDSILALAVTGLKNKLIAEHLKIDAVTVGLILNSPTGKAKLAELQKLKQETIKETLESRVAALQDKCLSRVETFINSEEIAENAPVKMFDRAMQVLRGVGTMKAEAPSNSSTPSTVVNNNTLNVVADRELMGQLNDGVQKALEASKLHADAFKRIESGRST